ncbi:RlmN [Caligus rogercresseyi]|uniref:RlmN n=1 Tax=Caligus rogercresseyi TaxID=217165 RepID=A0A7T8H285_CALRO|nr:RlmN [Caligus rogercresseyi]
MLKDVNDSDEDARRLVKLIKGIPAKINLIRQRMPRRAAGYASPIRTPRGEDIMAACGQLKSATEPPGNPVRDRGRGRIVSRNAPAG